jgi:hypothetical protein
MPLQQGSGESDDPEGTKSRSRGGFEIGDGAIDSKEFESGGEDGVNFEVDRAECDGSG